ncbi:MAG TPA: hypothetical protein PKW33_18335 [Anaerolineaceae bacterium]|nr:hypothetical protein [Anaerolineaceae bacterium]
MKQPAQYRLESPLDLETCKDRLRKQMREHVTFGMDYRPLYGEIREDRVTLRMASGLRNPLTPHFYGVIRQIPGGTELAGEFKTPEWARAAIWVWGTMMVLAPCGLTAVAEVFMIFMLRILWPYQQELGIDQFYSLLAMPALLLFLPLIGLLLGVGLPLLFIAIPRNDPEKIKALLERTLEAQGKENPS